MSTTAIRELENSMESEPRLKIRLIRGWAEAENPAGPATYVRQTSPDSGALQFSFARYASGSLPNATEEQLIQLCQNMAAKVPDGRITLSRSGTCDFGIFGTIVVRGNDPFHLQIWVLSDRRNFIFVTHTCMKEPLAIEIDEANDIALLTRVG
jgi:hypothetical protein